MKEVLIRVRIQGDEIETIIKPRGFEYTAETSLTIIGILQNMIGLEQDKLKAVKKLNLKKEDSERKDGLEL